MSTIKKAYKEIVALLEDNQESLVSEVLPQIITLAQSKTSGGGGKATVFHRDDETGEVVAVKCYYHKLWMDPRIAEFGKKATSPTGLNNMCKEGVSKWTKQQREVKAAEAGLLAQLSEGTLLPEDIAQAQEDIVSNAARIEPREDDYGFETLDECIANSAEFDFADA